jgi:hypothetical protein
VVMTSEGYVPQNETARHVGVRVEGKTLVQLEIKKIHFYEFLKLAKIKMIHFYEVLKLAKIKKMNFYEFLKLAKIKRYTFTRF